VVLATIARLGTLRWRSSVDIEHLEYGAAAFDSSCPSRLARDFERLNQLVERYVHPLYALRERTRGYEVAVMKAAMEILGKPAGPVRPPLMNCKPQDVADL
jgi:hypothetical protein